MDADGEDRPEDISRLVAAFQISEVPVLFLPAADGRIEALSSECSTPARACCTGCSLTAIYSLETSARCPRTSRSGLACWLLQSTRKDLSPLTS